MTAPTARLLIVTNPVLDPGFRLGGVATLVASTAGEAEEKVRRLVAEGELGVIAVQRPFLEEFDPELRRRLESSASPVVMSIPDGLETESPEVRRARLAEMLQRAVGYHIAFGEE